MKTQIDQIELAIEQIVDDVVRNMVETLDQYKENEELLDSEKRDIMYELIQDEFDNSAIKDIIVSDVESELIRKDILWNEVSHL